jgi:hypothetical protein
MLTFAIPASFGMKEISQISAILVTLGEMHARDTINQYLLLKRRKCNGGILVVPSQGLHAMS